MPLRHRLANDRIWAVQMEARRPGFSTALSRQQMPRRMWIGCSDGRGATNQITGLEPGEVFVQRNGPNVTVPAGLNGLTATPCAVDLLDGVCRVAVKEVGQRVRA